MALKCIRDYCDPEVPASIARPSVTRMQMAFVLDLQKLWLQCIKQSLPDRLDPPLIHIANLIVSVASNLRMEQLLRGRFAVMQGGHPGFPQCRFRRRLSG